MFSQRIEEVIRALLVDGVITERERQVIRRLAEQEGIDADTCDVLLDARIQEMKKEQKVEQAECPHCGAQLDAFKTTCPFCGHEIGRRRASSSMKELNEQLARVSAPNTEAAKATRTSIITSFPVPNTREDLLEFLSLSAANAKKRGGLLDQPFARYAMVIAAFWLGFTLILAIGSKETKGYPLGEALGAGFVMALIIGSWFGIRYAKKGGDKSVKEHNAMVSVWRTKFDQVMTKARMTLVRPEDVQTLDRLQREVYGK